ncbi:MAG: hypothetical protein J2P27_09210 [Actinobacteria bacterium]|nr:hypothetical protein [Actinomycetota bacterium]
MTDDKLVAAYLRRLRRAARRLPRAQRQELIDHITEYIAESRAADAASGADTTAALRNALERLGEPKDIVAAEGISVPAGRPSGLEIAAVLLLLLGGVVVVGWVVGVILLWISPRWRWPYKLLGTLVWPGGLATVFLVLGYALLGASAVSCSGTGSGGGVEEVGTPVGGGTPVVHELPSSTTATCSGSVPPLWASIPLTIAFAVAPILVAVLLLRRTERQASDPAEPVVTGLAVQ